MIVVIDSNRILESLFIKRRLEVGTYSEYWILENMTDDVGVHVQ